MPEMEFVMSAEQGMTPLTDDELMAQGGTALPDKEVASVLDLNADLNLGISAAAPIDLGVAANANVAAPIDAGASANVLSFGSESQALADQGTLINQGITGDATAHSVQDSGIDQGTGTDAAPATTDPATTAPAATDPAARSGVTVRPQPFRPAPPTAACCPAGPLRISARRARVPPAPSTATCSTST